MSSVLFAVPHSVPNRDWRASSDGMFDLGPGARRIVWSDFLGLFPKHSICRYAWLFLLLTTCLGKLLSWKNSTFEILLVQ